MFSSNKTLINIKIYIKNTLVFKFNFLSKVTFFSRKKYLNFLKTCILIKSFCKVKKCDKCAYLAPETLTREGHAEVMTKPHQMGAPLWFLVNSPFKGTLSL